jgi:hypothetical protein
MIIQIAKTMAELLILTMVMTVLVRVTVTMKLNIAAELTCQLHTPVPGSNLGPETSYSECVLF